MKTQNLILTITCIIVSTLPARRFVGFDGDLAAPDEKALGVSEVDADANEPAPVNVLGVMLVEAGGTIAQGAEVQVGADGKAIAKDTGAGCGYALDDAVSGALIRIVRGI